MLKLFSWQFYTFRNYGDLILDEAVRYLFHSFGQRKYFRLTDGADLRYPIGPRLVEHANKFDARLVAGGGLLYPRNHETSGWTFNCSTRLMRKMERTVIFAVGYNVYKRNNTFSKVFKENFEALLERTVFTGLRNNGSIEKVKESVDKRFHSNIYLQPCPTTFIRHLVAEFDPERVPAKAKKVVLQITLGGSDPDSERISRNVLAACLDLRRRGYEISIASFFDIFDEKIVNYLRNNGFDDFSYVKMDTGGQDVLKGPRYFSGQPLVVSTRGHGAMVPFGSGSAVIPVNVAPKVVYFANDSGLGDHVVDIESKTLSADLVSKVEQFYSQYEEIQEVSQSKRREFYEITLENLSRIYFTLTGEAVKEKECLPLSELEVFLSGRLHAKTVKLEGVTRNPDLKK
ncbi:MAG: polysaccharide pyruvyl transferase family protein [Pikeienuella sp.]|uniref:polysaccharide pyruvyl transferase family protein n=1 Tax=Pikeienuella sp. TaxID=2831957 RepID=UPI003919F0CA